MSRIAIVIGVNKPKGLAPLQGAVRDATEFADWLDKKQGFQVKLFTDVTAPVTFASIFDAVDGIVNPAVPADYSQIVIYFAGHGFQTVNSEVWLLSGAPNNASEAISLEASIMAARESGLKSVVFISDACRSVPKGLQTSRVTGGMIFPNQDVNRNVRPKIDRLFATLPSRVAVEAAIADDKARRNGIFTQKFMTGYRNPPSEIIDRVNEDGRLVEVVTNSKLESRLRELVEDAAFAAMPNAEQLPEFILESELTYVGRVELDPVPLGLPDDETREIAADVAKEIKNDHMRFRFPGDTPLARKAVRRRGPSPRPSATSLVRDAIDVLNRDGAVAAEAAALSIRRDPGMSDAFQRYAVDLPVHHFETCTGFSVTGAAIVDARSPMFTAEQLGSQLVRLLPVPAEPSPVSSLSLRNGPPSASVLIEFDNGNGVVLPGLRGYIGHIFVEGGVVANVNYLPSDNTERWADYLPVRERTEALRATVAAAASVGVFHIAPAQAEAFANTIRQLKLFDPTLGVYAAYAYANAGIYQEIESVAHYMKEDLGCDLFDVAMLARRKTRPREAGTATPAGNVPILPFCPMLRQGWSLLAAREAELPDAVLAARDFLLPALWTTFAPDGVRLLRAAIERGDFR